MEPRLYWRTMLSGVCNMWRASTRRLLSTSSAYLRLITSVIHSHMYLVLPVTSPSHASPIHALRRRVPLALYRWKYSKVSVDLYSALSRLTSKALTYGTCYIEGSHSFIPANHLSLSTSGMNHTCLYSPAAEHHRTPPRVGGWVGLGGLMKYCRGGYFDMEPRL